MGTLFVSVVLCGILFYLQPDHCKMDAGRKKSTAWTAADESYHSFVFCHQHGIVPRLDWGGSVPADRMGLFFPATVSLHCGTLSRGRTFQKKSDEAGDGNVKFPLYDAEGAVPAVKGKYCTYQPQMP